MHNYATVRVRPCSVLRCVEGGRVGASECRGCASVFMEAQGTAIALNRTKTQSNDASPPETTPLVGDPSVLLQGYQALSETSAHTQIPPPSLPSLTETPAMGKPGRNVSLLQLVFITYFCVSGGCYGLEDAVRAGYPLFTLLGILIMPWVWSLPVALMTGRSICGR